jgi:hypothetical protein
MSTSSPRTGCSSMPLGATPVRPWGLSKKPTTTHWAPCTTISPLNAPGIETDPMTGRRTSDDAGARVHDDPSLSSGKDVARVTIFVGPPPGRWLRRAAREPQLPNHLIDFPRRFRKGSVLAQREDDHAGRERNPTGEDHRGSPTSEQVGSPRSRSRRLRDHRETEKKYRESQSYCPKRGLGDFRENLLWRQPGDIDAEDMMRYRRRGRLGGCRPSFDSAQGETWRGRGRERRSGAADVALFGRRDN